MSDNIPDKINKSRPQIVTQAELCTDCGHPKKFHIVVIGSCDGEKSCLVCGCRSN